MVTKKSTPDLAPKERLESLRNLPKEELAALLAELAATHPVVLRKYSAGTALSALMPPESAMA